MSQVIGITREELVAVVSEAVRASVPVPAPEGRERLLSPESVEKEYGIKARTLERWRNGGIGPEYSVLGRRVYYERRILEEWIAANRVRTTACDY